MVTPTTSPPAPKRQSSSAARLDLDAAPMAPRHTAFEASTRCSLLLCIGGRISFMLATHCHVVMLLSGALVRALIGVDHCYHGMYLLL